MTTTFDRHPSLSGYEITETLYQGSKTEVYRALRLVDEQAVVIKLLQQEYPTFGELLHFRNQYAIAKNLQSPGIIRPLCLETYRHSYALVMEDFGGISLREYTKTHALELGEFLEIALQLTDILHSLYQNRVIHKDIKPANILIHPQSKQVKLIDFSISSLLPKETQEIKNPQVLEGTLAYISPEQTGRMNRGIDYRSDFYSLGVTLFELLTGQLPFQSDDPMELVHCHIAKTPPSVISEEMPPVLADIVMKLMAKNAEERYQSALGLKHDLEKCRSQWQETGNIIQFELGERDICDRFIIPEKLYGRESEVQQLLEAFERVASGRSPQPPLIMGALEDSPLIKGGGGGSHLSGSELMLVAGFSGIGKTAVVNEVHKPIVRQRGYFIKGKYDQFQRNIPLSAFVQAFRDLIGQLLSESDTQLQTWKTKILKAVGDNGQVLIDVIPELENIIGVQPSALEIPGNAAQNRFNLLMQNFVQVFTSKEHPLVIFLDDLQWADLTSLKLLKLLMQDTGHLLVLGAYRDNEVSPAHPFILTVNELVKTGATVNTITLQPLSQTDMNKLVADTLSCDFDLAQPLTDLVGQKTQGNPFFATQFLKALYEDKLITFNPPVSPLTKGGRQGGWQCDIAQVRALALTDDVVEFMALQLQKLPTETQDVLKLAACIGAQFDLQNLALVSEASLEETASALWKSLQEGLIIPISDVYKFFTQIDATSVTQTSTNATYKFLHDRVQQAAYSLIPEEQKQSTHLNIGQLLLENYSAAEKEERVFAIVNQLNIGRSLISQPSDKDQLVKLNLTAALKSKKSTAYGAAIQYLETSIELLPEDSWNSQFDLTRTIYEEAAEAAYLSTNYQQMEQLVAIALSHIDSLIDKIRIYEIKMLAARSQGQLLESVQIGLQLLQLLGIEFPAPPTPADIGQASQQTLQLWKDRSIASLLDAPVVNDPVKLAVMRILNQMVPAAYPVAPMLVPLLISKQINLSIADGNCEVSAIAYANYGLVLCGVVGDLDAGYQFGQLALNMLDRFQSTTGKCRVYFIIYGLISHWKESLHSGLPFLREGYQVGLETGDSESVAFNAYVYCMYAYFAGNELSNLAAEMEIYHQGILQLKQDHILDAQALYQQIVLNLLGQSQSPTNLIGSVYDESQAILMLEKSPNLNQLYHLYYNKTVFCYLFGEYQRAAEYIVLAESYLHSVAGTFAIPLFSFYSSLLSLALCASLPETEQTQTLERVATHQEKLEHWAHHAPMNHLHKWHLVEAEKCRVLGNKTEAIENYDRAIQLAQENNYTQEEALANELAAKFYLDWGKTKVAQAYMMEAYYCYSRWGAKAKVEDLEKRYPQLLQPILQQRRLNLNPLETITTIARTSISTSTHSSSTNISDALDFSSILKAAQAISSSIELDELMTSLTRILLENSGAKKSALILLQNETWQVMAITSVNHQANSEADIQTVLDSQPLDTCQDVPRKIIQYVKNTQKTIIIDRLKTEIPGLIGEYMLAHQPQSVFCTPIVDRGHLVGILYLENQVTSGVFTSDRLQLINLLSSQAAISLENARLYQQSQQAFQDLQHAQLQIVQSEKMSALGNLVAGVAHEINNPVGFISGNIHEAIASFADIKEYLQLYQEKFPDPGDEITEKAEELDIEYLIADFPQMLNSIEVGCDRIKGISTSLRTFSRADKDYKVHFNIHDGIDSTILILKHRLKANEKRPAIEVVTEYGDLPNVECFPGQLNQVFMNIIANAIDALDESNTGRNFEEIQTNPNRITIQTSMTDNQVKITIADNGMGMSEEVKQKVFDHLFTTKGVGKGTGLGMAIARQIVEDKHRGKLKVKSKLGEGTEFMIILLSRNFEYLKSDVS